MKAVVGLLVLLVRVSYGVETHCDGRQDGVQCYGALGGTVDIQLMNSTSEMSRYQLLKNSLKILDVRNNEVIPNITERSSAFNSSYRTFRINNLRRNDSGNYTLQTFDSDGRISDVWTLQLFIQAPVSSVLLLSECLSQGEMRVSCSSEGGDSPQYSWTLDGRTLTDAQLLSVNNESNIITLKQHVSGHLVCSVRNNVSDVTKEKRISTCGYFPLVGVVLSAAVIYLVVGVALICAQRKTQNYRPTKPKNEEGEHEVTYANLEVMKQQEKRVEQTAEVENGQVRFSKPPQHTEPTEDDCLYARVHKVRTDCRQLLTGSQTLKREET
ncbi:hepatocyte cell adhesion molecule-like [Astatotilapia calliptera]|uniref:hepatocyte cell adhesion molecule-like n=1 Tax=Astatotilapia calliptera TaxID=8154 RepID=UPI000E429EE1|nr:hepatocyte cell adhesion molecule-like [Astatotilapia calliptera]